MILIHILASPTQTQTLLTRNKLVLQNMKFSYVCKAEDKVKSTWDNEPWLAGNLEFFLSWFCPSRNCLNLDNTERRAETWDIVRTFFEWNSFPRKRLGVLSQHLQIFFGFQTVAGARSLTRGSDNSNIEFWSVSNHHSRQTIKLCIQS